MKLITMCLVLSMMFVAAVSAAMDAPRMTTAAGRIASIDSAANSLVVKVDNPKGDAQDVTFVVADDSKIVKNGAAVALSELKQGEKITVTYRLEGGKNVIVNIGVESKS
jgi:Cu/Ag efflux protein CusF